MHEFLLARFAHQAIRPSVESGLYRSTRKISLALLSPSLGDTRPNLRRQLRQQLLDLLTMRARFLVEGLQNRRHKPRTTLCMTARKRLPTRLDESSVRVSGRTFCRK